jgi:hypothetical protein
MTTEELREATREFDEEFVADRAHPLTPQMEAQWKRARGEPPHEEAIGEEAASKQVDLHNSGNRVIHRIGGASIENLRLKPKEARLKPPGISVLKSPTPGAAAADIRAAYPDAEGLHEAAKIVASTTIEAVRSACFDVIHTPSRRLPNHHRLIHPEGVMGFTDENLTRLALVFTNTTGN